MTAEALGPLKDLVAWHGRYLATCPGCGWRGMLDDDQVAGRVSVDCPSCPYHETHDHREVTR